MEGLILKRSEIYINIFLIYSANAAYAQGKTLSNSVEKQFLESYKELNRYCAFYNYRNSYKFKSYKVRGVWQTSKVFH